MSTTPEVSVTKKSNKVVEFFHAFSQKSTIRKVLSCIAVAIVLWLGTVIVNQATTTMPDTPRYANLNFDGNGVIGGVKLRAQYLWTPVVMTKSTNWITGTTTYGASWANAKFEYVPEKKEYEQVSH